MQKKKIVFLGILFFVNLILVPSAFTNDKVTFAVGDWPPYIAQNLPNYGPLAEFMTLACKESGYDAEYTFMLWSKAKAMTQRGDVDASFPWLPTEDMVAGGAVFSPHPLLASTWVVFYKKQKFAKGMKVTSLESLKPYKLVGLPGYWYQKEAREKGLDMHTVHQADIAWQLLAEGERNALIEDLQVGNYQIHNLFPRAKNKFGHSAVLKTSELFVAYSKKSPQTATIMKNLDDTLQRLIADGTYDKVMKKYGL